MNKIDQPDIFMTYSDKPYTNILKGTVSDAKLKYLDIRNYFETKEKVNSYCIRI